MPDVEVTETKTCGTCGMLGLRRSADGSLLDAPEEFREHGVANGFDDMPVCAVRMRDFSFEVRETRPAPEPGPDRHGHLVRMLRENKSNCPDWARWYVGLTPRGHIEMIDRDAERRQQSFHNRLNVGIAAAGVAVAVIAIVTSVWATATFADRNVTVVIVTPVSSIPDTSSSQQTIVP